MEGTFLDLLIYFLQLLVCTLGVFFACGLLVHLIARLFSRLLGRGSGFLFDVTSIVGTPVHELGHAAMCLLFGHKITRMRLWTLHPEDGVYGFVEHSYSKRNAWAKFGNLFIGMGPLFSGLGVTVLVLWLCFPALWGEYLGHSAEMAAAGSLSFGELVSGVFLLFRGTFEAFRTDWLRSLLGLLIILSVALHISLSPQDIRSSLGSLPLFLLILAVFTCATFWTPARDPIFSWLTVFNLRLISLFVLVIGFSLFWLALALLIRLVRLVISWF